MARRYNELYLGNEFLNATRDIKHVGLMREFGSTNVNKAGDDPINLVGLDLETNHKTAELKLFGIWNGEKYHYHTSGFLGLLFNLVDHAFWSKGVNALAYWNKLDPFVLYKQFLLLFGADKQHYSMTRYGKISGRWNKQEGVWIDRPVIEVEITRGFRTFRFGIKNVIRSSVQFFYYEIIRGKAKQLDNETHPLTQIWAYDIAQLYKNGLEKEMTSRKHLFPYYSKIDKSAHLVDWDRFDTDEHYKNEIVLKSNEYDARAVYDLGTLIVNNFKTAFHYYPRNLISTGAIARAAIVATLKYKYSKQTKDKKKLEKLVNDDLKAIPLITFYDIWHKQLKDDDALKDMFCLFYESYSGGYIEAIRYGLIKKGYFSDIASAYIKHITELYDLRGSTVTHGKGVPPIIANSYCFVRGTVDIPLGIDYMPITVKHILRGHTSKNVRATGKYIASYTINERSYMIDLGATFKDETWYNIETLGERSPLGEVAQSLVDLRTELLAKNDSAEYLAKTSAASIYGITFEATNTFIENDDLEIARNGYRGGEFLNPLFAAWTTAETRLQISRMATHIDANGGKCVLLMTDCVFMEGNKSSFDYSVIRDKKTLGFFETPQEFSQMASLGTGRYSYIDSKEGYVTTKNRGLNISAIHNPDGIELGRYNWIETLKEAEKTNSFKVTVKVRKLISVGMILHTKIIKKVYDEDLKIIIENVPITVQDLGRIITTIQEVDLVTGLTKRYHETVTNIKDITRGSIKTDSLYFGIGMQGDGKIIDQTLPLLREGVMKLEVKTARKRDLTNRSNASYKYNKTNKDKILSTEKAKYKYIKNLGFNRDTAKLWCKRSYERIQNELIDKKKKEETKNGKGEHCINRFNGV